MKKLAVVLSAIALCLATLTAFCQHKSDFSDWNVPPPIPPGTLPKSTPAKTLTHTAPPDVQSPSTEGLFDLKLAALPPVSQIAPDVDAPRQPDFPQMPFVTIDIPSPQIPDAVGLPKQTQQDQVTETYTDMPEPAMPDLPESPKTPDEKQLQESTPDIKIPLTPAIASPPALESLPADSFLFMEWPLPAIPESISVDAAALVQKKETKKIMTKKEPAKKRRGG